MIIEVNKLLNQSLRVARDIYMRGDRHPLHGVTYSKPVRVDLNLVNRDRAITLTGGFSTTLLLTCHRCLAQYESPLAITLDLKFVPRERMPINATEVELDKDDMKVASYQDVIDICQVIDEQVVLALPMKHLCSEGCLGLCPRCGKNLNEGACSCSAAEVDARLVVLEEIKKKMFGDAGR